MQAEAPALQPPTEWRKAGAVASKPGYVIRGQVIDDSLNVGVAGAWIFVDGTKHGAIADAQGRFELVIPASRPEAKAGQVKLRIEGEPFTFRTQRVVVPLTKATQTTPLLIRLASVEGRGYVMGKPYWKPAPEKF